MPRTAIVRRSVTSKSSRALERLDRRRLDRQREARRAVHQPEKGRLRHGAERLRLRRARTADRGPRAVLRIATSSPPTTYQRGRGVGFERAQRVGVGALLRRALDAAGGIAEPRPDTEIGARGHARRDHSAASRNGRGWIAVVELRPLPLRAEQALLGGAVVGRSDLVAGRAQIAHAREIDVDHGHAGGGALEQDLLRRGHHREPALGMIEQVLRGHHQRKVFDRARPDQRAPGRPQRLLVLAGRHEDQLGAAQRQRARHLRHVDLAAHREPDLAVHGVEHRELVARHVLELPRRAAGVDPRPVRMRAAVARRRAAVGIGHADEVVGGRRGFRIDRLERAEHDMHAVPLRGFHHGGGRIERRRHPPRPGIGLRESRRNARPGRPRPRRSRRRRRHCSRRCRDGGRSAARRRCGRSWRRPLGRPHDRPSAQPRQARFSKATSSCAAPG